MKPKLRTNLLVLSAYIILTSVMRFFSFFPTEISHDESTYFVIAREMLLGKLYFVDLIDTKPVGIFLIIGGIIAVFGKSIFMIRFITALIIAITAFVIYKIALFNHGEQKPAIASGVIFIFFLSIFTVFGVYINPELYYLLFTALGFYIFLRRHNTTGFFLSGLLLGVGFMIKYVVLFDLAAFLLYYFIINIRKGEIRQMISSFLHCFVAGVGFLIPFGVTLWVYYHAGHLNEFMECTFGITSRYPVDRTLMQTLVFVGDFHLRFLPVIFFFYYVLFRGGDVFKGNIITRGLMITWCMMVLIAILLPGKAFGQYFIQMMLPVSIYAGNYFNSRIEKPAWLNRLTGYPVGTVIIVLLVIFNVFMQKHDFYDRHDEPKMVADYLKTVIKPEDRLYTGNYRQILYYLLDKDCPVKYVHRTLMCSEQHRKAFKIDLPAEMTAMMNKNIKYILMEREYCYEPMNQYIRDHYEKIKEFPGEVTVYKRNE